MKASLLGAAIAVAAMVLLPSCASAQIALTVTDKTAAPVTVQSADITTEVVGRLAVTTFDMVFRQPE